MSITIQSRPSLMVGVPSAYLSPRLPFPPNPEYTASVGVEIAPGLGVSLDGKTLLVGPEGHQGKTEILGRLSDATMPQRDTVVLRSGEQTVVEGYHDWQDFALKGKANGFEAQGDSPVKNFQLEQTESGFRVESQFPARAWTIEYKADGSATVQSDFDRAESFVVSTADGVTKVDSSHDDHDFTLAKQANGEVLIDGRYSFQDFRFSKTDDGHQLKGHYPQQLFKVVYS